MTLYFYLLLVKHAIADLWLQSRFNGKPKYGEKEQLLKPKLYLHSLDHAVLTALVTLIFAGLYWAIIIAILDFVLHSIIDYVKRIYTLKTKLMKKIGLYSKPNSIISSSSSGLLLSLIHI